MSDPTTLVPKDLSLIADWQPIDGFNEDLAYQYTASFAKRAKSIAGGSVLGLGVDEGSGKPGASFVEVYTYCPAEGVVGPGFKSEETTTTYSGLVFLFSLFAPVAALAPATYSETTRPDWDRVYSRSYSSPKLEELVDSSALSRKLTYKRLAIALAETRYSIYPQSFFAQSAPEGFKPKFGDTISPDKTPKDRVFDVFFQLDWGLAYT
ncbi:hypothetical protein [Luteimonas sp. MC1895]|uniref:hypothetical protein n=1 Tax=Luteimonas sp. MC1895 TaxID=2819513 RepID=UPI0018F05D64|nr:hypothetical protein [Luteimonas sp. MC1895]MBJ6978395.1 hypothetical protein [Luteimonas sp. MC1895]